MMGHPISPAAAAPDVSSARAVETVASGRLEVAGASGWGILPVYTSHDWSGPLPGVTRAVIVIHGQSRNADTYFMSSERAAAAAEADVDGVLIIAPQFLAVADMTGHGLPAELLHWQAGDWPAGLPAQGPVPISSYDVIDRILARLADRRLFPALQHVVLAGHSAGGQLVQRYAVVGRGEDALTGRGISLRYVVANPSSYLYFDDVRSNPPSPGACPGFNRWKYGLTGAPPYVGEVDAVGLETRYIARDVVYLLGGADNDPHEPSLDKSCAGEAQGPNRHARGLAFFAELRRRHPDLRHRMMEAPGIGHDGGGMLNSAPGVDALFDAKTP